MSESFVSLTAEIGVLLLLLALGLEYDQDEMRAGLRTGLPTGVVDMLANGLPGVALGLILGWEPIAAVLLGGVTWVSSSGIVSKVLFDLDRLGFRETPSVLNVLVIEDLAMAVYLPVVAALVVGGSPAATTVSVALAIGAVGVFLAMALRYGTRLTALLGGGTDESLLLAVFGLTLLVAGLAQSIDVSGAIGAFLVGLALSGHVGERSMELITPLRDLFAAIFFVVFSFRIDPADTVGALLPAIGLVIVTGLAKMATGWYAGRRAGIGQPRAPARRHGIDRARRILDRDRSPRLIARRWPRSGGTGSHVRAAGRCDRAAHHALRRPDPDPRTLDGQPPAS